MRSFTLAFIVGASTSLLATVPSGANAQEVLVVAKNLDTVNNPAELERVWRVIDTDQVKLVGDAIAAYYGCPGCVSASFAFIDNANVLHFSDAGEDHKGAIQAPVGYTICRAYVLSPSVNCGGTFTGYYCTADHPNCAHIDGLHWYMVVPRPGVGQGRCWANGTVVVEFLNATPGNRAQHNCGQPFTVAFHYGR